MKITKLHLKDFKVFDDLELDFTGKDGQPLNQIVLAGLNGTGKTTILEVIKGVFESRVQLHNKRINLKYEYNGQIVSSDKVDFDQLISNNRLVKVIYRPAKIRNTLSDKDIQPHIPRRVEINVNEIYYKPITRFMDLKKDFQENFKVFHAYNKLAMKEIILSPIKNKVFENKEKPPIEVIESEIANMNSIFKGIDLNSRFVDIDDNNLFFESVNGQRITFEELSSGEKQLYFMGFMLKNLNINNTIIMIDEPEDSLHPKWQSQLLQFYSNIGENNQVILATHSPHIIGSAKAESVFLLKNENGKITASNPKYSEGHSIPYVLSEIMDVDYRNTYANNLVDDYLTLIRKGEHTNEQGKMLLEKIEALNLAPNSEEQQRIDLSLRRFEAIGR